MSDAMTAPAARLPLLPADLSSRLLRVLLPRLLCLDFARLRSEGSSSETSKKVLMAMEVGADPPGGAPFSACRDVPPLVLWETHFGGASRRRRAT